jgi:hypothetical protein
VLLEGGKAGDAIFNRQVAGEQRHGVRGWSQTDSAVLAFRSPARHISGRIRPVRGGADGCLGRLDSQPAQVPIIQVGVHCAAGRTVEMPGLTYHG